METNIKSGLNEESNEISKKKWLKPECEIISKDIIKGGPGQFYTEGQTTILGFKGQDS